METKLLAYVVFVKENGKVLFCEELFRPFVNLPGGEVKIPNLARENDHYCLCGLGSAMNPVLPEFFEAERDWVNKELSKIVESQAGMRIPTDDFFPVYPIVDQKGLVLFYPILVEENPSKKNVKWFFFKNIEIFAQEKKVSKLDYFMTIFSLATLKNDFQKEAKKILEKTQEEEKKNYKRKMKEFVKNF